MRSLRVPLLGAVAAAALAPSLIRADEPKKADPARSESAKGVLTDATLLGNLRLLGYDPVVTGAKKNFYRVTITRNEFRSVFTAALSSGGSVLWLTSNSGTLGDPARIPAPVLLRLLEESGRLGPAHFSFEKAGKLIVLNMPLENRDMTLGRLRKEIEAFADTIRQTWALWKAETLQPLPEVVDDDSAKAERRALQGTWKLVGYEVEGKKWEADKVAALDFVYTFEGTKCLVHTRSQGGKPAERAARIDLSGMLKALDLIGPTGVDRAIFKIEGDTLTVALGGSGGRPTAFSSRADVRNSAVLVFRKQ